MSAEPPAEQQRAPAHEPGRERFIRHGYRVRLYAWAAVLVAALVLLIALVVANTRSVKLDWLVGSTHASLVWVIIVAGILGWLLGIATSILFRRRTRRLE